MQLKSFSRKFRDDLKDRIYMYLTGRYRILSHGVKSVTFRDIPDANVEWDDQFVVRVTAKFDHGHYERFDVVLSYNDKVRIENATRL